MYIDNEFLSENSVIFLHIFSSITIISDTNSCQSTFIVLKINISTIYHFQLLMYNNVLGIILGVHLSTLVYRK